MQKEIVGFHGNVWIPLVNKKSIFRLSNWKKEQIEVFAACFERLDPTKAAQSQLQVVLSYQNEFYIVTKISEVMDQDDNKNNTSMKKIEFIGKSVEQVRLSYKYFTAVTLQSFVFYIEDDKTKQKILDFVSLYLPKPPGSPKNDPHPQLTQVDIDTNKIIEDAFTALAKGQEARDNYRNIYVACQYFRQAEEGFGIAQRLITNLKTQQLFEVRRAELRQVVQEMERIQVYQGMMTQTIPGTQVLPNKFQQLSIDSLAKVESVNSSAGNSVSIAAPEESVLSPTSALNKRLENLQTGSKLSSNDPSTEKKASLDDLKLRLQALKSEKSISCSDTVSAPKRSSSDVMDTLQRRLEALRSPKGSSVMNTATEDEEIQLSRAADPTPRDPVETVIMQAKDELALGISDEEVKDEDTASDEMEKESDDTKSSVRSDEKSSESSKDDDEEEKARE